MKRSAVILAGLAFAAGMAFASQETGTQSTDPYDTTQTEDDKPTGDPEMGTLPEGETDAYGTETGEQSSGDISKMSPDQLMGMTVTTEDGEELGTIEQVGYSTASQEQVATINVGGFLGVGEKIIAVPLSELQMGSDDSLTTSMSREEIQSEPEFDPSDLGAAEQEEQQDW